MVARRFKPISIYAKTGSRKYLNGAERVRFLDTARTAPIEVWLFCCLLFWTGCRISEALAVTAASIDLDEGTVTLNTLKRRKVIMRQVPLPSSLIDELAVAFGLRARQQACPDKRLWKWSRTTAWRRVKTVMKSADVLPTAAMPKGLRHSFGVSAFRSFIPPHLIQRWLGHASLKTTSIYGDVVGAEEHELAARLWTNVDWRRARSDRRPRQVRRY